MKVKERLADEWCEREHSASYEAFLAGWDACRNETEKAITKMLSGYAATHRIFPSYEVFEAIKNIGEEDAE